MPVRAYVADPTHEVGTSSTPTGPAGAETVAGRAYLSRAAAARAAAEATQIQTAARRIPTPRPAPGPRTPQAVRVRVPAPELPDTPWLLVLDGAPGTEPGAVAAALPVTSAAHPGGLSVLPGLVGGAAAPLLGTTTFGSSTYGLDPVRPSGIDQPGLVDFGPAEWDERSRCLAQTAVLRALPGRHLVARDWVSALAAAAAVSYLDGGRLLRARAGWAQTCVVAGLLRPADGYVVLDLEPRQSMARTATAPMGDPRRDVLVAEQFRAFWLSPASALRGFPALCEVLRRLHIERVDGRLAPSTLAQAVRETLG